MTMPIKTAEFLGIILGGCRTCTSSAAPPARGVACMGCGRDICSIAGGRQHVQPLCGRFARVAPGGGTLVCVLPARGRSPCAHYARQKQPAEVYLPFGDIACC